MHLTIYRTTSTIKLHIRELSGPFGHQIPIIRKKIWRIGGCSIHKMVEVVKEDQEASLEYMKIFEREQMLIEQGRNEGRNEERKNTEKERKRADRSEQKYLRLKEVLKNRGLEELLIEEN